jgi:hypothetical protein
MRFSLQRLRNAGLAPAALTDLRYPMCWHGRSYTRRSEALQRSPQGQLIIDGE